MTRYGAAHPLDVDLADLVDGLLDDDAAAAVEAHLGDCLLCRVKRMRLLGAPAGAEPRPFPPTPFAVPDIEPGGVPEAGDVWLAGEEERLLVVVLRASADRALVAPMTFDVDAADEDALVLDAIGMVAFPRLAGEVPASALVGRLAGISMDLTTGQPGPTAIGGDDDPRLELRQHLADRLASLGASTSALIDDLRALRGSDCVVRALDAWPDLGVADRDGWVPLATVDEIGVVLVVLDTPHGLAEDRDYDAARAVLTRFNASALVVTAGELSDLADVFDAPSLNHGIDVPTGAHTPPRPLISGLAPFDAIAKYLDQHSGARMISPPARGPVASVDVAALLREAAGAAADDAARQGARFKIAPKRRGYESLADASEALAAALGNAFTDDSVVDALLRLAQQGDATE